jgi:hypothetical protein
MVASGVPFQAISLPGGWALILALAQVADPAAGLASGPPVPLVAAVSVQAAPKIEGRPTTTELPLRRDGETTVAADASFRVDAAAALRDARLVLYDAQDALVPAEETAEIGSAASRFTVAPGRPLRGGARYVLRLEGAAGRDLRDLSGTAYRPVAFSLLAAGEPPPPPRPARKKGSRSRSGSEKASVAAEQH